MTLISHALLEVLGPILHQGFIDGYSHFGPSEMDEEALDALALIRARARKRRSNRKWFGNPENYGGVEIDMSNDDDQRIVRHFGAWTTNAEIYSEERRPRKGGSVLCFDHSGESITAELTDQEAAKLVDLLPEGAELTKL